MFRKNALSSETITFFETTIYFSSARNISVHASAATSSGIRTRQRCRNMNSYCDVKARPRELSVVTRIIGWGRVASPTLGRLYPRGYSPVLIYRRLSGPQGQPGDGVRKNLHSSDTGDRTRVVEPIAKRLAAWATWPTLSKGLSLKTRKRTTFTQSFGKLFTPVFSLPAWMNYNR